MNSTDVITAFCYLETAGDEKNKAYLTEKQLVVVKNGRDSRFDLPQVKKLSFEHRKPMLFLLGGGIVVPFTALAYYRDFLDPFPTLALLISGLFGLYFGWLGYDVLSVDLFTHKRDFRLKMVSSNLRAFVNFTMRHLPVNSHLDLSKEKMIYHITTKNLWRSAQKKDQYPIPGAGPFIHASEHHQIPGTLEKHFKGQKDLLMLTIDPLKVKAEIKYEDLEGSGQLFPHIYGALNFEAVEKIEELAMQS